jgi:hypothetical protein
VACRLQIDAGPDPVPDQAYHFDADPDADPGYQNYADPSGFECGSMQIRIRNIGFKQK